MGEEENMQFPIPNAVLEPYIREAVSTAIASSLGDGTKIIEQAVQAALLQKVNHEGKVSQYRSDNKHLLIEVLANNKIREIAVEVINQMATEIIESDFVPRKD